MVNHGSDSGGFDFPEPSGLYFALVKKCVTSRWQTLGGFGIELFDKKAPTDRMIMEGIQVKQTKPWIIAHRGARDEAPENTGSALRRAMDLPVDGVEFDVQMSSDGVPILYHDRTLYKVARRRSKIGDLTRKALEQIDWGGWYHKSFAGEPLTTLEKALTILNDCPRICIEIKSHPEDKSSGRAYQLTEKVVQLLNRPDMKDIKKRSLVLSFDPEVLTRAYRMDDGLKYVLNLPEKDPLGQSLATQHLWAVDTRISNLCEELVRWAHALNLKVFTYTCNGKRQVGKAVQAGVDAIITDRPAWLIRQFGKG